MSTKSSGLFDPTYLQLLSLFEGEGGDEGGDEGSGEGEQGSEGSSGTENETVTDPDKKRLSDEAAKYRVEAKNERKAREEAEAKVKAFEDKDKTETERLQADSKSLSETNATLQANNVRLTVQNAALLSASKFDFRDINDAMKFAVDGSGIQGNEDNLEELITEALTKLAKDKPYLLQSKSEESEGSAPQQGPSGRPTNGKKGSKGELDEEFLRNKFPALQR